jgi:nucleoside-diphosphate-sugar epimerase
LKSNNLRNPKPETRIPKLLITGIEGFTGKWLYDVLKDKYDIYGTCLNNVGLKISGKTVSRIPISEACKSSSFSQTPSPESRIPISEACKSSSFSQTPSPESRIPISEACKSSSFSQTPSPESRIPIIYTCDITNYSEIIDVVDKVRPDFIIHLAALSFVNLKYPLPFYKINVIGTENLLNALLETGQNPEKIILASSANIYGRNAEGCVDEEVIPEPVNHYSISKLAMEFIAKNYMEKLKIIIARPFNYTGPGQEDHFLIPKIVRHYKEKKENIELGNLDVIRDFSDVRFVCECYDKLLENGKCGEVYNICSSKEIHLKKIIDIMNSLAGYNIKVDVNPEFVRKNEIYRLIGDNRKILSLFDSNPVIEIEKTLEFMYGKDREKPWVGI